VVSNPFRDLILPAVQSAATALGAVAFELEDGEHILLVRGTERLLLYVDPYGRVIMPYCSIIDAGKLQSETADNLRFHQHGEPLAKNAWIWFPRVAAEGATSYDIKVAGPDGAFAWFIRRVLPLPAIALTSANGDALIADLGARIAADFNELIGVLNERVRPG
jgi:hypothetical protein